MSRDGRRWGQGLHRAGCAVLLCVVCYGSVSAAAVYRCERDGTVIYADKPCAANAKPADLPTAIVVPAGPAADLLKQAEEREAKARAARDKASAEWLESHEAGKAEAERIRDGRVADEIVEGMSESDVRRMRGEPAVVSRSRGKSGPSETWSYVLDDGSRLHVTLVQGKVTAVRTRKEKK
ncbi:MAG TPA: hypothetical protein VGE51_09285 [Fontimonas sp.]